MKKQIFKCGRARILGVALLLTLILGVASEAALAQSGADVVMVLLSKTLQTVRNTTGLVKALPTH